MNTLTSTGCWSDYINPLLISSLNNNSGRINSDSKVSIWC